MTNSRKRIIAALERRRTDRPPTSLRCIEEVWRSLEDRLAVSTPNEVLDSLDVDLRWLPLPFIGPPERSATPLGSEGVDFWGCRNRKVQNEWNSYYEIAEPPLANARSVAEVQAHSWPSLDWWDYAAVPRLIEEATQKDRRAIMFHAGGAFETPWMMRGLEQFLVDLQESPEIAEAISDKASRYYHERALRVIEAAGGKIDVISSGGDVGTQTGMLLSPTKWRAHIRGYAARLITPFRKMGLKTFYHSCGS
jgi:uroporphyrinogen decarboxylase